MKINDIKLMFEYNYWANKRILSMAEQLTAEQVTQTNDFSWGSLHGTLLHILDTEYGWRVLCQQGKTTPVWTADDYPDLSSIQSQWEEEENEMWEYLDSLSDDDIIGTFSYGVNDGTRTRVLWHCLYHLVNHGTQHRSECAVMLTDLGQSPGDIDFVVFLNQR